MKEKIYFDVETIFFSLILLASGKAHGCFALACDAEKPIAFCTNPHESDLL